MACRLIHFFGLAYTSDAGGADWRGKAWLANLTVASEKVSNFGQEVCGAQLDRNLDVAMWAE